MVKGGAALRFFHIGHRKFPALDIPDDFVGLGLVFQVPLLFLPVIMGQERPRAADTVQHYIERPIFLGLKSPDLLLPVHHHPGGNALDTSGGESPADLLPQQGGQLIAHNTV